MSECQMEIVKKVDYFPSFQKPVIVGYYSVDENRQFRPTTENLQYLYRKNDKINFELDAGFKSYIAQSKTLGNDEKIDSILVWLNSRLLATIMRTPFENQEGWLITATKIKNAIFLCSFYTEEKMEEIYRGQTEKEKHFEYWGYKFEQYVLTSDPRKQPETTSPVNANEEFTLVYRSKLNDNYLVFGAETDGIDSKVPVDMETQFNELDPAQFVELKTSRFIQNARQDRNFRRFKLLKWWSQSFLVGIENIICGFRDDHGVVFNLKDFKTRDLPKMAASESGLWDPVVCMRFLDDFLSFVKDLMKTEPDNSQWTFVWKPEWTYVKSQKMTDANKYKVLPSWFISKVL